MGYCSDGWWLNQQFCCWEIEEDAVCSSWHLWSPTNFARWIIYVLFAVRHHSTFRHLLNVFTPFYQGMFSFIAAHLVKSFAKYAAGSGISEIKCILAGFIMKGYLGGWTLVLKSITLVRFFKLISRSQKFLADGIKSHLLLRPGSPLVRKVHRFT